MKKLALLLVAFLVIHSPVVLAAGEWRGLVVHVVDGDTMVISREGDVVDVRLYGVDAPEMDQAFGPEAKAFVEGVLAGGRLCDDCPGEAPAFGGRVLVKPISHDRYRRTVARVVLPDGRDLSQALVRDGLAWWYRKYAPKDEVLATLEAEAKAAGRGLWGDVGAVAPWRWRNH